MYIMFMVLNVYSKLIFLSEQISVFKIVMSSIYFVKWNFTAVEHLSWVKNFKLLNFLRTYVVFELYGFKNCE